MSHVPGSSQRIRVLFVVPSELSSGEGVTVLHMCEELLREGDEVLALASPFSASFLAPRLGASVRPLTDDVNENGRRWDAAVREFNPDAVVFADYPLLHFSNGISPLITTRWSEALWSLDAALVTLDHLGYAQREMRMSYGPPHLSLHSECTPVPSGRMAVILPCPMNAPDRSAARLGTPFRYQEILQHRAPADCALVRSRFAPASSHLVVHTTPNWAWRIADDWQLPHYPLFDRVLEQLLSRVERPVVVVSVNNGALLAERDTPTLTIRNSGVLSNTDYEALLEVADLLVTDNAVSVTIGRAAARRVPVVCLRNRRRLLEIIRGDDPASRELAYAMEEARPGAIFPFDVFPIWNEADVDQLGLFRDNPVTQCVLPIEMYGGADSAESMRRALEDADLRGATRGKQDDYFARVAALPSTRDVLQMAISNTALRA